MRNCKKCGAENLAYPAHCHSTGVNDEGCFTYTCCVCLGHGVGASGACVQIEAELERDRERVRQRAPYHGGVRGRTYTQIWS